MPKDGQKMRKKGFKIECKKIISHIGFPRAEKSRREGEAVF